MLTARVRVFPATLTLMVIAACGGNAEGVVAPDGSVPDVSIKPITSTAPGTRADTGAGFGIPDVASTFVDTGIAASVADTGSTGPADTAIPIAAGDTGTPVPSPDDAATHSPGPDAASGGGVCPSSCSSDSECAAACPPSPGAINCCDTVTSACFTSAAAVCPDEMPSGTDSGTGGGY